MSKTIPIDINSDQLKKIQIFIDYYNDNYRKGKAPCTVDIAILVLLDNGLSQFFKDNPRLL
jgi:hypothetical protein